MKKPARIISQNGKNYHLIWTDQTIRPGDKIIDVVAFENEYDDAIRMCEDTEDADFCNSSGGYSKLICGPDKIGYFMVDGTIHHDRVVMYIDDYTVEELHPDTIPEILDAGGECEIHIHNTSSEKSNPTPFLVDGKVLIHKK